MSLLQTSLIPRLYVTHATTSRPHLRNAAARPFPLVAQPDPPEPKPKPKPKPKRRPAKPKPKPSSEDPSPSFPGQVPRKPRRGRRSEAQAVEDFVRATLEQTFASIREKDPEAFQNVPSALREKERTDDDGDGDGDGDSAAAVVEEESGEWPLDADVGWGIRASEYFEKHPIKNVVGDDGFEIDWEGELDDNWVQEINCLEWESFAFHPSPLVVLVFERYNRATDNWKALKELEKAVRVYWEARDKLPPRSVKIDINIEKDLAYALKVKEGPQILFLRGTRILHREKEFRTADELVQMIAHFYYNAKRPSCMDVSASS